MFEPDVKSI